MKILRGSWFVHFFALDSTNSPDASDLTGTDPSDSAGTFHDARVSPVPVEKYSGTDASDPTGTDASDSTGTFHDSTVSPVPIEKCCGITWK